MAVMIPAEPPVTSHSFEKDLFEKFKETPAKWKVYPQFYVQNPKNTERHRELDFVVLIPDHFSVIYLEAKSGGYEFRGREWYRTGSNSPERPSPPEQATSGMFALKQRLENALGLDRSNTGLMVSFGCAVAFRDRDLVGDQKPPPDVSKLATLIGRRQLNDSNRLVEALAVYAKALRKRPDGISDMERWTEREHRLAHRQFKAMETMLDSDIPITKDEFFHNDLESLLPELLEPTIDQQNALRVINSRDRCVIDGAAGTGKTVLAMKIARKKCEDEGKSVALVCSNPNLSDRFASWSESLSNAEGGKVIAGTPASLLSGAFNRDEVFSYMHQERLAASPNLETTLKLGDLDVRWSEFVDETLADLEAPAVFDYLVIDEAQNLCDKIFLTLFDKLLKGGLVDGEWSMFGDFENQNIVTPRRRADGNATEALKEFGAYFVEVFLATNCRNTYNIAEKIAKVTGIEFPTRPGFYGPPVAVRYFDTQDQLAMLLEQQLNEWNDRGFESNQIIMLTSDDPGSFGGRHEYGQWKLVNIGQDYVPSSDYADDAIRVSNDPVLSVRLSDVFDFQGLESDLGILVMPTTQRQVTVGGVNTLPDYDHLIRILYTGMSRISVMLVVIADRGYRDFLEPPGL